MKGDRSRSPRRKLEMFCFEVMLLFCAVVLLGGCASVGDKVTETPRRDDSVSGVKRGLVVLVEFPDVRHSIDRRYALKRFGELDGYVQEMSYHRVRIETDVTEKWHRMPHPVSYYKISPRNLEVDKSRVTNLIRDALDAVERNVDLARYDFVALFLGAQRQEYGMIGLCGYPGMLGWGSQDILKTRGGQRIRGGVAIFCYQAHLGTLFHDVAHILGGLKDGKRVLPCLYDHDLQAKPGPLRETFLGAIVNMGLWDPMSCHYNKWEDPPPGVSSWTKLRMNWIDPSKVSLINPGEKREIVLGPLAESSSNVLVIKIPLSPTTCYLIENRQPVGFDRFVPGKGVLIMYADDNVPECRHGNAPVKLVNADPRAAHLQGAAFDVGKKDSFVDEKNGVRMKILESVGSSYKILVSRGRG